MHGKMRCQFLQRGNRLRKNVNRSTTIHDLDPKWSGSSCWSHRSPHGPHRVFTFKAKLVFIHGTLCTVRDHPLPCWALDWCYIALFPMDWHLQNRVEMTNVQMHCATKAEDNSAAFNSLPSLVLASLKYQDQNTSFSSNESCLQFHQQTRLVGGSPKVIF